MPIVRDLVGYGSKRPDIVWPNGAKVAVSVAMTKRMIYSLLGELSPEKAQAIDHKAFTWAGQQADSKEGVSSFLEKRKPAWKMKASKDFPDFLTPVK